MSDDPARIRDVLKELGAMGIKAPTETAELWTRWAEIVGDQIAKHASPSSLRDGVLRLRVESPTWATEIGYLGEDIRSRVNAALRTDTVREVRAWVGSRNEPVQGTGTVSEQPRDRAPARRRRDADADPQEAFQRARGAWLRKTRGVRSVPRSEAPDRPEKRR